MRYVLLLAAFAAAPPGAQARSVLRVHVTDSTRAAVVGADVSIMKGVNETLTTGTTDSEGRRVLSFAPGDIEVVVRKIGYARAPRFLHTRAGDTTNLEVVLVRA